MDAKTEREELSTRLAELFDEPVETVWEYQKEIENDDEFYSAFDERWKRLKESGEQGGKGGHEPKTKMLNFQLMYVVCRITKPDVVVEKTAPVPNFRRFHEPIPLSTAQL